MQSTVQSALPQENDHESAAQRYDLLVKDMRSLHARNPAHGLELARSALHLARSMSSPFKEGVVLTLMGACHLSLSDHASALESFTGALRIFREIGAEADEATALCNIGIAHNYCGRFVEAIDALTRSLAIQERLKNPRKVRRVLMSLARSHAAIGDPERAIPLLTRCLGMIGDEDEGERRVVTTLIANLHRSVRHEPGDPHLHLVALGDLSGARDLREGMLLLSTAELYCELGQHEQALHCAEQGLEIHREIGSRRGEAIALSVLADVRLALGDPASAARGGLDALAIVAEIGEIDALAGLALTVGRALAALGDRSGAIVHLERALASAERGDALPVKWRVHESLAELYEAEGRLAEALEQFRSAARIRSEVESREARRAVAELRSRVEVEQAGREREVAMLKSSRLELELLHKERELSAMSLSLRQRNEIIASFRHRIDDVLAAPAPHREGILRELLGEIGMPEPPHGTLRQFQREVDKSQQEFDQRLSRRYPQLTPTELRICSLLRGSLATKEIAALLNVSTRNVETHRYHIRKKLGVSPETSLSTFLIAL